MVGILLSYWGGLFSEAMLVLGSVPLVFSSAPPGIPELIVSESPYQPLNGWRPLHQDLPGPVGGFMAGGVEKVKDGLNNKQVL